MSQSLFGRTRLKLALWYTGVMGVILSLSGVGVYQVIARSQWTALRQEMESTAGTLHDSVEPMLPASGDILGTLQRIFPELCLSGEVCAPSATLLQRHTSGVSDRGIYLKKSGSLKAPIL